MTSMAMTIPSGVLLLILLYLIFYRFTPLNAKQSGLIISLLALAIYLPIALLYWPGADVLALNITVFFMVSYLLGMLFSHREKLMLENQGAVKTKWFHWGPAVIVGFFVVILIVDAVFVTLSKEGLPEGLQQILIRKDNGKPRSDMQFPGVMYNNYQKKEQKYNQYLRQLEKIDKRGWILRKGWLESPPTADQTGIFQFVIEDPQGNYLQDAIVSGRFMRASDSKDDVEFTMDEVKPGIYQARLNLPYAGLWHVNIDFTIDDDNFEVHASTTIE